MKELTFAVGFLILVLAVPAAAQTAPGAAIVQTKDSEQSALKPADALKMLKDGNERFVTGHRLKRDLASQVRRPRKASTRSRRS